MLDRQKDIFPICYTYAIHAYGSQKTLAPALHDTPPNHYCEVSGGIDCV